MKHLTNIVGKKIVIFLLLAVVQFFLAAITTLLAKNYSVGLITKTLPELKCNQLVNIVC